jgi:hypothetical protein
LARGGQGALGIAALSAGRGFRLGGVALGSGGEERAATAAPPPRFPSAPDLVPPALEVVDFGASLENGLVMTTPSPLPIGRALTTAQAVEAGLGMSGMMITNPNGSLVWFLPESGLSTNLQVQQYRGQPVLSYWTGRIDNGIGYGSGYLLDLRYDTVAVVKAGNGLEADLHELTLTPQNTALVTAYRVRPADLSAIGGPEDGQVFESVVQEVDIATKRVLLQWNSLDHVPVSESYMKMQGKGPQDYFHVNSVALWDNRHLLVSARNTWAVYLVDRRSGALIWRLGGKRSDFSFGSGARFFWQHHVRRLGARQMTVFDDGAYPPEEPQSRGLILNVDTARMRVTLARAFEHPAKLLTYYEGSVQVLPDGNVFVGWGTEPYSSEFTATGELIADYRFPTNDQSYRAFRYPWTALPRTPPSIVLDKDDIGGYALRASWNGATEIASWQVLSGVSPGSLEPIAVVPKSGFETAITTHPRGPYVSVAALDVHGRRLGLARPLRI